MVEIEWAESAKKDFKNLLKYISQDSPSYSEYFLNTLLDKVK